MRIFNSLRLLGLLLLATAYLHLALVFISRVFLNQSIFISVNIVRWQVMIAAAVLGGLLLAVSMPSIQHRLRVRLLSLRSIQRIHGFMIALTLGYCLAAVTIVMFRSDELITYPDTTGYLEQATQPLTSSLWMGTRAPGFPIFCKMAGNDLCVIATLQIAIHVLSWSLLAWVVAFLMRSSTLRLLAFMLILGFSLSSEIVQWDRIILTESLLLSLFVLCLAMAILGARYLARGVSRGRQILLGLGITILAAAWSLLRDPNGYTLLALAGLLVLLTFVSRSLRARMLPFLGVVIVGLTLTAVLQARSFTVGRRWVYPLTNIILGRILPDERALAFFTENGMPADNGVMAGAGETADYPPVHPEAFVEYYHWLEQSGLSTYARFLLQDPLATLAEPLAQRDQLLLVFDDLSFYRISQYGWQLPDWVMRLSALVFPHGSAFYWASGAVLLFTLAVMLTRGLNWRWLLPLGLLILVYPTGAVVWYGDAMEVGRHSLQTAILWRLGIVFLLLISLDQFLARTPAHPSQLRSRLALSSRSESGTTFARDRR